MALQAQGMLSSPPLSETVYKFLQQREAEEGQAESRDAHEHDRKTSLAELVETGQTFFARPITAVEREAQEPG